MARQWDLSETEQMVMRLEQTVNEIAQDDTVELGLIVTITREGLEILIEHIQVEMERCEIRGVRRNPITTMARAIVANKIKEVV